MNRRRIKLPAIAITTISGLPPADRQEVREAFKGRPWNGRWVASATLSNTGRGKLRMLVHHDETSFPLGVRLDEALAQFRQRLELHFDQQNRLQRCYHGWQGRWTTHCQRMTRQMAILEGLLSAWMTEPSQPERFGVVSAAEQN
jgi:hypothetical protein